MRALYLTYNGLTSLIGRAQVWPYVRGLARAGHRFDVLSFEEQARAAQVPTVLADLAGLPIAWHPRRFRRHPPLLAKWLDARAMRRGALGLARQGGPGRAGGVGQGGAVAVHARSYVAGVAGLAVKRRLGLPLIFDMRGFWVDGKVESGRWPQSNPLYAAVTRTWRAHEAALIGEADHIVVLAQAAARAVEAWPSYRGQPISVIPCAVDHGVFALRTPAARDRARAGLGIAEAAAVLVYLGSLGGGYLLGDMLRFFARFAAARPGARFLLIGPHDPAAMAVQARAHGVDPAALVVRSAEHGEVPGLLAAADLAICFRGTSFSAKGVSLTKLGEYLAVGLPVVVNDCAGDIRAVVEGGRLGLVLPDLGAASLDTAVARAPELMALDPAALRAASQPLHDLRAALARYGAIYDSFGARP